MEPNAAYIVLNRIYDVIGSAGLGAKNTLDKFKLDTAFVDENGVLFSVDKDGAKSRITVGDLTLGRSVSNNKYVRWECDANIIVQVFGCTDDVDNDIFKTFLATLAGQNIPRDKLLIISEIATALVVEYSEFLELYAVRSIKDRNEKIAALQTRADDAEKRADELKNRLSAAVACADSASKRVVALENFIKVCGTPAGEVHQQFAALERTAASSWTPGIPNAATY